MGVALLRYLSTLFLEKRDAPPFSSRGRLLKPTFFVRRISALTA
jgi:hypothetical protein